jgi:hypothetical protein
MTITAENRKGMRQAHSRNASDGRVGSVDGRARARPRNRPLAMMKPSGAPTCGKVPYQARLPTGAFSVATRAAPLHSPPRAKPWARRRMTSMNGAHQPIIS